MVQGKDLPGLNDFMTVGEAAEFLGLTATTLRNWDKAGKLRPRRNPMNGYRLYLKEELEAVLQALVSADGTGVER